MARAPLPLIVIGASAGGLDALAAVLDEVSPEIPAAILVVIHIGASEVQLPRFFEQRSPIPVRYAKEGERVKAATVFLAPPDWHLLVAEDHMHLAHGPKENHTRPAIDPLFRSAAAAGGPLVTGVILTGNLTDGTAGLWEIKRRGGTTIVQDPEEAAVPSMPRSALNHVDIDHCLKLRDIGRILNRLTANVVGKAAQAASAHGESNMIYTADKPLSMTCPDCGGSVREVNKGTYTQFQCHIGHTFGMLELACEQFELLESSLGASTRLLNERRDLCRKAAGSARAAHREQEARIWDAAAEEAEGRFTELAKFLERDWQRPEREAMGVTGDKAVKVKK
jgi:two-component system, chemotaxis family, protein-glutamate methylesterase/glutaminase